jgi:hypothetical protein
MDESWTAAAQPRRPGSRLPEALLLQIQDADFVLPLGEFCEAWMLLADMGLRGPTYPFDYLGMCVPSSALRCLEDFRSRWDDPTDRLGLFWPQFGETWNNSLDMQFGFMLPPDSSPAEIEAMRTTFVRRVDRLRETLAAVPDGGSVVVLHTCYNEPEEQTPLTPLLGLLAELKQHWCPQAGNVSTVSIRPREAASKPELWAGEGTPADVTEDVTLGFIDLPDYGGILWPDRMIAFRAAMCAACGFRAYRSAIGYKDRFPWTLFVDEEDELEPSRYGNEAAKEPRFET